MRGFETIPQRVTTALLSGVVGATALAGCGEANYTACSSPRAVSGVYPGDTTPGVTGDHDTWREKIVAHMAAPKDGDHFHDFRIGYQTPGGNWHDSNPVWLPDGGYVALLIGNGPVQFSGFEDSEAGSGDCTAVPVITFGAIQPRESGTPLTADISWP